MLSSLLFRRRIGTMRAAVSLSFLATVVSFLFCFQGHPIKASGAVAPRYEGVLDGANCGDIGGWAWDANDPYNPINVDIYSDNVLVTTVLADVFRQDLLDANIGNGAHGFDISTPASLIDGQPHSIRVSIGGTNVNLSNSPKTINCAGAVFGGFHDGADCNRISGWAWDAMQPNTPIDVDVYIDDDTFRSIQAPADKFRQDLVNAGIGNGFHGFVFSTPTFLKDGQPHSIRMRFTGTLIDLNNTPKSITCSGNLPPAFGGFHDGADCTQISGWAWDANAPNATVSVDIYSDNMLIATAAADLFRQDLANAGIGDGRHGFILATPPGLKDGQTHTISVGIHDTGIPLNNTYKMINCP